MKVEVDPGEADEEISRVAALTGQLGRAAKLANTRVRVDEQN